MPDHPSAISGVFKRPFTEQAAFFRNKLGTLVPTSRWDDIMRSAHDRAFMVAGAAKADLLTDLAAAVDRAVTEGRTLQDFRKDFRDIVERNGWHGWTGEATEAGRAWRTRVIYQTNASTSYAAGRNAQLAEGDFEFLVYRHGGSREPRPVHLSWDGLTLPANHEFWSTHMPPNDWGCSCYVVGARSAEGARRLGGRPDKSLPADWNATVAKTGAPPGIGKGWDYRPGATVENTVRSMAEKVRHWDHQLGKAFMNGIPDPASRDRLATAYRALPSVADDTRRYARRIIEQLEDVDVPPVQTLGLATRSQVTRAKALKDLDITGYDWSITPGAVNHIQRNHGDLASEARRGNRAVTASDYARLPGLLNAGLALEDLGSTRHGHSAFGMRHRIGAEELVLVWEVRPGRRTLALQTMFVRRLSGRRDQP